MLGCALSGLRRLSSSVLDSLNFNFNYIKKQQQTDKRDVISWNDVFHNLQLLSEPVYWASSHCHYSARFGSLVDKVRATAVYVFEHFV
jgi:hypothetical protein